MNDTTQTDRPKPDDPRRFVVCVNMPGYLPESETYVVVGADNAWEAWKTEMGTGYSRAEFVAALDAGGADGPADDDDRYVVSVTRQMPMFVPGLTSHAIGYLPSYAWPGGYPIAYVTADGSYLCAGCVNTEPEVHVDDEGNADWRVVGFQVLEGDADADYGEPHGVRCDHCGRTILAAEDASVVRVGDYVESGAWGAGQPRITGTVEAISQGEAVVRLDNGEVRSRSLRNLRRR